jgi:hypothetical protein
VTLSNVSDNHRNHEFMHVFVNICFSYEQPQQIMTVHLMAPLPASGLRVLVTSSTGAFTLEELRLASQDLSMTTLFRIAEVRESSRKKNCSSNNGFFFYFVCFLAISKHVFLYVHYEQGSYGICWSVGESVFHFKVNTCILRSVGDIPMTRPNISAHRFL